MKTGRIYAVVHILDMPYHADKALTYYLTPALAEEISVGSFVTVPLGAKNRHVMGVVTELHTRETLDRKFPVDRCKPAASLVSSEFVLTGEMLGLCRYLKEMTFCSIGEAAKAVMPTGALRRLVERYALPPGEEERARSLAYVQTLSGASSMEGDILLLAAQGDGVRRDALNDAVGEGAARCADHLVQKGLLARTYTLSESDNTAYSTFVAPAAPREDLAAILDGDPVVRRQYGYRRRSPAYAKILSAVLQAEGGEICVTEIDPEDSGIPAALRELKKDGLITLRKEPRYRNPYAEQSSAAPRDENALSEEQAAAKAALEALYRTGEPRAALLHGVTGSGKTRVIKAMMDEVLADGRQVIMLVPEIALTPQTVTFFCSYYGRRVAVVHSSLSAGERLDVWRQAKRGEIDIVIGTRSAVFVPFERLGMIVMDEEQEHTYKSDANPKYHARDAARYRCAASSALLLLASATPSFESYYKAKRGIYSLITLKNRYGGARLPEVIMADMHEESLGGSGEAPLGAVLSAAIEENRARGEQTMLFVNRRGYQRYISCLSCREPVMCPHCSVPMTLHKRRSIQEAADESAEWLSHGVLVCHYCGERVAVPTVCPSCTSPHLHAFGYGTQRAEEELWNRYPDLKVTRMDTDTTKGKFSHTTILSNFRDKNADVLLGTQMIAKGHDFPSVTLVGVLSADALLYQDDYRAAERAFSLLTQVIGRAGRGEQAGRAVIQTYNPDHEVLHFAAAQDYEAFYERAIAMRQAMVFPPFCDMVLVAFSAAEEYELMTAAEKFASHLSSLIAPDGAYSDVPMTVFGPFEAQIYRVSERFRLRMILKCRLNKRTRALLACVMTEAALTCGSRISVSVDVNPNSL